MGNDHPGEKEEQMKQLLILILITAMAASAAAQGTAKTSDDPTAIPDMLFTAMREKNAAKIADLFLPAGQLVAIDKPKDGKGVSTTREYLPATHSQR